MKLVIEAGAVADVISPQEMAQILIEQEIRQAAKSAGYKWTELFQAVSVPGSSPTTFQDTGPAAGFAWKMRMITCVLSVAGTIAVFKGESTGGRPFGTAMSVLAGGLNIAGLFYPDDMIVQPTQQIFVSAGAAAIVSYYRAAVQVPAERLGEHLS